MQTLRSIVSDLSDSLKALNLDDRYSYRYLANLFRDQIATFLRQEARSREILKQMGSWKSIECIEFEEVPLTACGDIGACRTLRRSTIRIPEAYETNYGLIFKLLTLENGKEFTPIQAFQYKDYTTREYKTNKIPYWIENRYIYIPDTVIENVKAMLLPKEPLEVDKLNGSCNKCVSPLDGEIEYSQYLIDLAKKEVFKQLTVGKQIVEDEKGDDNTNRKN